MVRTQPQSSTHDVKDERLVQSDLPIAQYRKHLRQQLGASAARRLPVVTV